MAAHRVPARMHASLRPLLVLTALAVGLLAAGEPAHAEEQALADAVRLTRAGAQAFEQGAIDDAITAFEAALEHAPDDAAARKNLALALSRRAVGALRARDGVAALESLDRALELHPGRLQYASLRARALLLAGRGGEAQRQAEAVVSRSPSYAEAWTVLANVRERQGDLRDALVALARVEVLRPGDAALGRRIGDLDRRAEAESGFATHGTGNFVAKYDPAGDSGQVQLALTILEDAYSQVTSDLGLAPRTPAQVVLYEGAEFQRVTGAHSWVGALYHNGVLRVPIRNLARHRATAQRVLTHEFTHHVLKERTPALPTWWHEGIAQHLEDTQEVGAKRRADITDLLRHQRKNSRLLTLEEMQRVTITRVANAGTVKLYYAQAHHFVGWLADTHGAGALPSFLAALGTSSDLDGAARRGFGGTQAELWKAWLDSI